MKFVSIKQVGQERLCIKFTVHRWFPVANLTLYREAVVYESHKPGIIFFFLNQKELKVN